MTARAHIRDKTKLASAIIALFRIPYNHARLMTEAQVLSLVQWHHAPIPKANDGPDVHWNLEPRLIKDHREYEAKTGRPQMAKADRLSKAQTETRRRILARKDGERKPASRWGGRKMQSREFEKRRAR